MNKTISIILMGIVLMGSCFVSVPVHAAQYNIKEMTPEVEKALVNRRDRYDQLSELKQKGLIGENNKGYVELLNGGTNEMRIVNAENADRKVIYQTIAQQNNLEGALATIEEVFAGVQKEKAQAGDMVQNADGSWMKK